VNEVTRPTGNAFRGLCAAAVVSEIGDWLLFIALPLYVLNVSGSALATSSVFLAELIPSVSVGTVCGPLIDRRNLGRLLTGLTAAQAFVVMPLLWAGPGRVWLVYAVAAVQAAFTSLTSPAQQAVVPAIVGAAELPRANGMIQMASNVARLVGSPLGGALLPVLGLRGLVLGDMASFAVSAVLLAALRTSATRPEQPSASFRVGPLTAIIEGGQAVRGSATLCGALIISFLSAVAQGLFLVLFVLFVLRSLHAGDQLVGLLRGVQAIGGVLGGLLVATQLKRSSPRALAVWGLAAFACISAVCWNSPLLTTAAGWYVALFILVGIPATVFNTGLITGTQQASHPHLRGRILSLLAVADALGQGTGILAAGVLGSFTPLSVLLNAQAGCYLTCATLAVALFGKRQSTLANTAGNRAGRPPSNGRPSALVRAAASSPGRQSR
jgi:MFS family permease